MASRIYEKSHTPEAFGKRQGTEGEVEAWLEQEINSLIVNSVPALECPAGSKKVVVVYEYMRVANAFKERFQWVRSVDTRSLTPQPGPYVAVPCCDWIYVLHWRVEIYCISYEEFIGVEGGEVGNEGCGTRATESAFARGVYGPASSKQEAETQAQQKATAKIFERLYALVSSTRCPTACSSKVYTYWMGDVNKDTSSNINLQGQSVYKSVVTIPYQVEVFCLSPTTNLAVLPF